MEIVQDVVIESQSLGEREHRSGSVLDSSSREKEEKDVSENHPVASPPKFPLILKF